MYSNQLVIATCVIFLSSTGINNVYSFPTGAPIEACTEMRPGHGHDAKNSPMPYKLSFDKTNIKPNDKIVITLSGEKGEKFRGFMLQARSAGDSSTVVGHFVKNDEINTIDCSHPHSTATHVSNIDKQSMTMEWIAPSDLSTDVEFFLTVVKVFETYWVRQKSGTLSLTKQN